MTHLRLLPRYDINSVLISTIGIFRMTPPFERNEYKPTIQIINSQTFEMKLSIVFFIAFSVYLVYARHVVVQNENLDNFVCSVCETWIENITPYVNSTDIEGVSLFYTTKTHFPLRKRTSIVIK
jgi:hypothetical protein